MPIDPIMLAIAAVILWGYYFACRLSDRRAEARHESPRRDTMPSLVSGSLDGPAHPPRRPVTLGAFDEVANVRTEN